MNYTYRDILGSELLERKQSNAAFSLRAFAKTLEMSPGHLSSLIHGKRNLTRRQAGKIISKLGLSPHDKMAFLSSAFPEISQSETKRERDARLLRDDEFKLISEWSHFAILSLGAISGNQAKPSWIAERLGISVLQARDALNRLTRMGLIRIYKDGNFKQTGKPLTTTDDIPSQAIQSFHKQNIDLAKMKLDSVPVELREFGTMTMAINPSKIKKAKEMIREFQNQICDELEVGKRKSVYTLCIQFFPVSIETKESK